MAIIFENIDTHETVSISPEVEGKYYGAKLSALINSSNLGINADRGQDFGYRLNPEQQAILEDWETDPDVIDRVTQYTKVPVDMLQHNDFLSYMLYQQNLGNSPEKANDDKRRQKEADYAARVAKIRAMLRPEPVAPFKAPESTLSDYKEAGVTPVADSQDKAAKSTKK
jgi:hypothetical protein